MDTQNDDLENVTPFKHGNFIGIYRLDFWGVSIRHVNEHTWLVVSTPLKNISQIGNLPQIGVKIKNIWNHHLDTVFTGFSTTYNLQEKAAI